MYGKGLYCVYDLNKTQTEAGRYGHYVYKFKINLYGFICFDPEVAQLVYKRLLTPVEQAQELGLDEVLVEKLRKINVEGLEFTSDAALPASKFLKGKVKGLIFTGTRDGRVAVVYDQTIAVPFGWKKVSDESWTVIEKSSLKPALKRSASGDWRAEKYDVDLVALLAKLNKLPVDKRVVKGNLDVRGTSITSLPVGLKVGGTLNVVDTSITSLPVGLKVGGSLNMISALITSLPADLQVGGNLDVGGTSITSLPAGLKVGGNLYLFGANIYVFPADLQVGGKISGFLGNRSKVLPPPPPAPMRWPPPPPPPPPPRGSLKDAMAAWKTKYGPKPLSELRMLRRLIKDYL